MCAYYSQQAHDRVPRTQLYWDALKFCGAVKKRDINGWCSYPGPPAQRIDRENVLRARRLFGSFIERVIVESGWPNPILVPIPSKDGLIGASDFRSFKMVREAMAPYPGRTIAPALRFTESLKPAHEGGPRGRYAMARFMVNVGAFPPGPVFLIDDLLTGGGTALAAYDCLQRERRTPVMVITCGYTVDETTEISAWGDHRRSIETDPPELSLLDRIFGRPA